MKIVVIGGTGMVGARVVAEARARGHDVIIAARKAAPGVVQVDATDAAALAGAARGAAVIISAAAPRSGGDPAIEAMAVAVAAARVAADQNARLIIVGGAGSTTLPDGSDLLDSFPPAYAAYIPEAKALRAVREFLRASAANWTFFAPAAQIAPGPRTGQYRTGDGRMVADADGNSTISAEDFAVALLDEVETPKALRAVQSVGY